KSIRAGRVQIGDAHAVLTRGEFFLINCNITPLLSASTHIRPNPTRSRKLLLHEKEIQRLIGKAREKGLTIVPLNLHMTRGKVKVDIALARGKKTIDKRRTIEERQWKRTQGRVLRGKG
ncbi:MAG: SsrA-binding protein SmpB, partial [Proteobacteria bacterium]|nr:SsrA-binding protein SmpB [Pseudomonadota bacterium]